MLLNFASTGAGTLLGFKFRTPSRLTYRVFQHWDYGMIVKKIENQNKCRQGHNRHLHVWRWEYYIYKLIGLKWRDLAYDRETWKEKVHVAKFKATKGNESL